MDRQTLVGLYIFLHRPGDAHPHLWVAEIEDSATGVVVRVVKGDTGEGTLETARRLKGQLERVGYSRKGV